MLEGRGLGLGERIVIFFYFVIRWIWRIIFSWFFDGNFTEDFRSDFSEFRVGFIIVDFSCFYKLFVRRYFID